MTAKTQITSFSFENSQFRVITDAANTSWFVAADVCNACGLSNPTRALETINPKWKATVTNSKGRPGIGAQSFGVVSEAGMYALIFKSRKNEAKRFQEWVFEEVLPTIRKTGGYQLPQATEQNAKAQISAAVKLTSAATGKHSLAIHKALREHFGYPNLDAVQPNQLSEITLFLSEYAKSVTTNALPAPEKTYTELNIPALDVIPDELTVPYYSFGTENSGYSNDSPIHRLRSAVKAGKPIASYDLSGLLAQVEMLESLAYQSWAIAGKPELSRNPVDFI